MGVAMRFKAGLAVDCLSALGFPEPTVATLTDGKLPCDCWLILSSDALLFSLCFDYELFSVAGSEGCPKVWSAERFCICYDKCAIWMSSILLFGWVICCSCWLRPCVKVELAVMCAPGAMGDVKLLNPGCMVPGTLLGVTWILLMLWSSSSRMRKIICNFACYSSICCIAYMFIYYGKICDEDWFGNTLVADCPSNYKIYYYWRP